jgi:hypothetical protein
MSVLEKEPVDPGVPAGEKKKLNGGIRRREQIYSLT